MIVYILSKLVTILFGITFPAYSSYKAIKTKDAKEYVLWMQYWVVFSFYNVVEMFTDAFCGCWFPFYYELKILFMFWLISPTTRGSTTLYRRYVHPGLTKHEKEIDGYLESTKRRTGNMVTRWGSKALRYVSDTFVRVVLRAPDLTREYFLENTQQQEGRMIQAGYDSDADDHAPVMRGYQNPREQQRSRSNGRNGDDFSTEPNMMHHRGVPQSGIAQPAQQAKAANEFGNFSMVTAQDGSMNNKPVIFGWYPYSETPAMYSPDISSGLIPSVFPAVLPTVPFLNPQETPISSSSSPGSSKTEDKTVSQQSVDPVEVSPSPQDKDKFVDPVVSEEHVVDDFFDCEEVEKKDDVKASEKVEKKQPAISPSVKVVGKTNLQAFDDKPSNVKVAPKTSVDNLARHSSSESLAVVHRKTASLTSLSKLDKTKARKSFSGTESKPKVALFSSQSFRRVLHPFVSSKSLTSSHSSKNISRSTTSVDAKDAPTKPKKS